MKKDHIFEDNEEALLLALPELRLLPVYQVHRRRREALLRPHWQEVIKNLEDLPERRANYVDCGKAAIEIGAKDEIDASEHKTLQALIQSLVPWRKGPFLLFGEFIDSEWRSDRKWDRIAPFLPPLAGKRLLDVGCSNGYYLFRASAHGCSAEHPPEALVGLDPSEAFFFAFHLFQRYYQFPGLCTSLFSVEHVEQFQSQFDVVLLMGILYHQRDPLSVLRKLRNRLKPGGMILVESQSIDGFGSYALFPEERYAKAHNVFFVPTQDCLVSWMKRAGFSNVEILSHARVTGEEQRKTSLMEFESLDDFLDPNDLDKTIEGYPAPWRTVVRGSIPL